MAPRAEPLGPRAKKRAAEAAYQALLEQILGKTLAPGTFLQEAVSPTNEKCHVHPPGEREDEHHPEARRAVTL